MTEATWHAHRVEFQCYVNICYVVIHYTHTHTHTHIYSFSYSFPLCFIKSIQLLSCVQLLPTPWTTACQASLFITKSQSLLRHMSIKSVMPSKHLIFCRPLLLWPSIFPSIKVFSNESVLCIRWPKYWSFSFSISPSKEYQSFQ